ncbi:hypothetical protein [Modicisalibacter sp. MOD 31.J]|uniref:hypothetical protein n=1 Tax=Modicisalibacter sp. MOD 31.J TaxID=2831897 RepID=UPI001CCF2BC4|nr:hypothetical protein [Modicisalibacter sp. MOD 31.J]MBZ9574393.1 hypothetical protein [Modicisalibacter sp. MOD 31.J]
MTDSIEQFPHLEDLVREADKAEIPEQAMRVILRAEQHHQKVRDQLQEIVTLGDRGASISLGEGGLELEPGTQLHKGFVTGIQVALHLVGKFPLKVKHASEIDTEDD